MSTPPAIQQALFDKKDQLQRIAAYLIPGESIFAVFDCKGAGTGFVGITDQRLIFFDQSMFSGHKAMVSIPYHMIIGVAASDSGVIFQTSELTFITAAGKFSFDFRGADKAQATYQYVMNQILNRAHPQLRG